MVILKVIAIWTILLFVAIANGTVRQLFLVPYLSDRTAHQISSVTGSALVLLVTVALIPFLGAMNTRRLLGIGLFWLALTVAFEFTLGHLAGYSWEQLLADYNLFQGRLWLLVLLTVFLAPLIAARIRGTWR
ncbi:MAG TPA: hypothetical protein PKG54_11655 [Phycisphaerae bacterium]|jgi:hypothetical protein|nr:hypothetical protein [Phycisphaerae bacterium]HOB75170.1 hypothetical protein [Phycisphaerae bacterium]HOJ54608.1 hypothetical protein [Phycisphaerae bacterium]HOL28211.1 hypothetical protein [Phycisphaerae bacterium]HPP21034.1 hypothetical protein [Phycisphaerae bacterium]